MDLGAAYILQTHYLLDNQRHDLAKPSLMKEREPAVRVLHQWTGCQYSILLCGTIDTKGEE